MIVGDHTDFHLRLAVVFPVHTFIAFVNGLFCRPLVSYSHHSSLSYAYYHDISLQMINVVFSSNFYAMIGRWTIFN